LETTNEHKNILDPIGAKKRLEDYEQMLQYYILMRTKNKMKDYDIESKKWWEVGKEYFAKELEKNLAQHRVNEKNLKYKLEIYWKTFLEFVYGSPTNIKTLGQDEETKIGPNGTTKEEEV
jgi:hypothetical protein